MPHQVFLLGCLLDEKSCQEYKYICLYQPVEDVEVKAEGDGHDQCAYLLDQFHNDEGTQDIAKQPHTQGKRPDENFQYVDRCDDGDWFSKTFQPFLQAFFVKTGILD